MHSMDERYLRWLEFAKGYLKLAGLCCQQLIDSRYKWSEDNRHIPSPFTEDYYVNDLLTGIFFNTKHGIELFLKLILIGLEAPNTEDHDLNMLLGKAKEILEEIDWKPITVNGDQHILSTEEIERLKEFVIDDTEKLILYFYVNKFLDEKLNVGEIPDSMNIVFKYPEGKNGKIFFDSKLFECVTTEEIIGIREKIITLHRHFLDIGYLISVDKRYQPRKK